MHYTVVNKVLSVLSDLFVVLPRHATWKLVFFLFFFFSFPLENQVAIVPVPQRCIIVVRSS